jgi:hypothetical protein
MAPNVSGHVLSEMKFNGPASKVKKHRGQMYRRRHVLQQATNRYCCKGIRCRRAVANLFVEARTMKQMQKFDPSEHEGVCQLVILRIDEAMNTETLTSKRQERTRAAHLDSTITKRWSSSSVSFVD